MNDKSQQPDYKLNFRLFGICKAGQSTFIKTASDKLIDITERYETANPNTGSEFGIVSCEVDGKQIEIQLLSNSSSFHFAHMDIFFEEGNIGFIMIVDSADPGTFDAVKRVISTFNDYAPCPYIIVANKQDLDGAQEIDKLRTTLKIPDKIPVVPCVATDKQSVNNVLSTLSMQVLTQVKNEERLRNGEIIRVIIIGAFGERKQEFIENISDKFNPDYNHTLLDPDAKKYSIVGTQGIIYLTDQKKVYELHLLESSGNRWMNPLHGGIYAGIIFLVDSTNSEVFRLAKSTIETIKAYSNKPFVIATDKQNEWGAWDVEALRIALKIPDDIRVVPCIATDKKSVANVLIALCEEVLKDIDDE